jgi:hypothetical protein
VRAPTTLMEYTFSPNGASSLLVLPPSEAPDSRPLYHVSSTLDPFIPTASVTTVCRGGHPDGEFVGDFECVPVRVHGPCSCSSAGVSRARCRRSRSARGRSRRASR